MDETVKARIERLQDDVTKVLAANAANAAVIDKVLNQIKLRLEVLEEDFSKNFSKSD